MDGFSSFLTAFVITVIALLVYIPLSYRIGLLDCPGGRKCHDGIIPLVGGVAMFTGILLAICNLPIEITSYTALVAGVTVMVVIGVVDDLKDLSTRWRFIAQILAATLMIFLGDVMLSDLGRLLSNNLFSLGVFAIPFTIFAVIGGINATNMTDGVDGLAGSMVLVILGAFAFVAAMAGLHSDLLVLLTVMASIVAFLCFNFPIPGRKRALVFMGDGGSMFLGFIVAWYSISLTQGEHAVISPITALWILGLPILDTIAIMTRRLLRGRSPLAPDREHFHHILQVAGLSRLKIVIIMMMISSILAAIGISAEYFSVPEYIMFYSYAIILGLYFWGVMYAWEVMKAIKKMI